MARRTGTDQAAAVERHQRETLLFIMLPFVGGLALLVLALVAAFLLPQRAQVSALSDILLTLLVLCPLALCALPFYILFAVAAVKMNTAHAVTQRLLGRLVTLTDRVYHQVDRTGDRISRRAIDVSARIAPVEHLLFTAFEKPTPTSSKEVTDEQSTRKPR